MIWGSVVDAYDSYDPDYVGDAGPISRTIASGTSDKINWLESSLRLLIGGDLNEYAARSSSVDEPLTPTAFNVKVTSNQGSARVAASRIDSSSVFVNRTGIKIFENKLQSRGTFDYGVTDLCQIVPEIGSPGIVRMAIQRQPDTRVHCVRSDGTVALLVFDQAEDVLCWVEVDTDGEVEDAVVLPAQSGITDDYVYYVVKREINGSTVRYLEKWAQANETVGGLGEDCLPSPFNAFSGPTAIASDTGGNRDYFYVSGTNEIWLLGASDEKVYIHDLASFETTPEEVAVTIDSSGQSGCLSKDHDYMWISGSGAAGGSPTVAIRTSDRTTYDFGGIIPRRAICATSTELITSESINFNYYTPNFVTPALGSASLVTTGTPLATVGA